jgi:hypothetical protein
MRWHYTIGAYLKSTYSTGFIYPEQFTLPGVRPIDSEATAEPG